MGRCLTFQSLPSSTTKMDRVCDEDVVGGTRATRLFTLRFLLLGLFWWEWSRLNTAATERTHSVSVDSHLDSSTQIPLSPDCPGSNSLTPRKPSLREDAHHYDACAMV